MCYANFEKKLVHKCDLQYVKLYVRVEMAHCRGMLSNTSIARPQTGSIAQPTQKTKTVSGYENVRQHIEGIDKQQTQEVNNPKLSIGLK